MTYCFVFVCQSGELEIKSMLLAASLKRYLHCDYELVAAIPNPTSFWGTISRTTLDLMDELEIRTFYFENKIDRNYPIGNKIYCFNVKSTAKIIIFLDSDILCTREFSPQFSADFHAKPADLKTFSKRQYDWEIIYKLFGISIPERRIISSTSGELMLPYFNAGVIAIKNGIKLSQEWEYCCKKIDAEPSIANKRPWLDQIALPIAIKRLGLNYKCLDERFNYPAHLKPLPAHPELSPFLCHYHWPAVIRREPTLNYLVKELAEYHPQLRKLISSSDEWRSVLKEYNFQRNLNSFSIQSQTTTYYNTKRYMTDAIITGIPRSGTSFLCRLLHSIEDCVVINEPSQIFHPLINESTPWNIAIFYQELRRDILDGLPIENKLHNGELIEDTRIIDKRSYYHPTVSRPDFLLCTKNTLSYLSRLSQLRRVLPHAPIIACIRNPIDTIASWKTSFPHLKNATVDEFPVGHTNDIFLSRWQNQRLLEISKATSNSLKRALLWRYLAEIILSNIDKIILVRYEHLIADPHKTITRIFRKIHNPPHIHFKKKITPSAPRTKRENLSSRDLEAIYDVCTESAIALGYDLTSP